MAANPVTAGPLPGHGLAQHPFLYCGEFNYIEPYQTIYLVRHGKVVWTYSIPTNMMVDGKPQMAELEDCTWLERRRPFQLSFGGEYSDPS